MPPEFAVFLGEMIRNPGEVRAIAPSSSGAARLITAGLEAVRGPIVEIGAGTGAFTRAILARGIAPERLTIFELNPRFCTDLREKFPGVRVLDRPAEDIAEAGLSEVGAVVSGVPVLAKPALQRAVVGRAFRVMAQDGFFTQITYANSSPVTPEMQAELGLVSVKRGTVWANLPPARIFEYRRKPA
ncbi:class I SAM-dependent methyltransferase [Celeribacter indicus]|uniref:Type 12 methyltransferase n=1 Tax=Celeribacter indicus TaxID=1208324 RepID=A0A0B5DW32_9RHOB|nr:methyltransferase type 12 [Celeribacter indicus]AJE47214.1 type 12 methyltransferase [Celeribacter indicus]SDW00764.1 Phospholipid N-methyltransferase [Celeribacter indicus]